MNLNQLAYVRLVAIHGSFSAAAREARTSQPTVSVAVSDLETELGGKLFRRTTRRVELTEFGRSLLPRIDEILGVAGDLQLQAQALTRPDRRLLRVMFSSIIDSSRVIGLFEAFRKDRTEIDLVYKECTVTTMESRLEQEKADIICGVHLRHDADRGRCVLYRDRMRFLPCGGVRRHRGGRSISLPEVARETLILTNTACGLTPATLDSFRALNLKPQIYPGHAISYQTLQEWSQLGVGAAILPESRIVGDVEAYPLVTSNDQPLLLTCEAVWNKSSPNAAHVKNATRYLRQAAAQ
jgi:LysR family hydrogen peroxide-inducible transcriptional activator